MKLAVAGLGSWGRNLVRNFDELADLAWLCDVSPERREEFARRYPHAEVTDRFDDLLQELGAVQAEFAKVNGSK